jgi:hypothetical protein
MANQGFTRQTGGVNYQQFSTQGVADPAYAAAGGLVKMAGDVYKETKTQQFADIGEELRLQGETTALLAAGDNPYDIQTGLTEKQVTDRLGTIASAGGYVPSEMEKADLLKAAQKVAKMQAANQQGLWSKDRYSAEVAILQRSLLNEYPHLKAEINDAMARAGVSGATIDYAYGQLENSIKQLENSIKQEQAAAKTSRDLYTSQALEGVKLGFGTSQEAISDPVGYLTSYGAAIQQHRMLSTVKQDAEALNNLKANQADQLIQQTAQVNVARANGIVLGVVQKYFGPETTLSDLPSLVNDGRYAQVVGEVDAIVQQLKTDPLRVKDKEKFDAAHQGIYDMQKMLHAAVDDPTVLKVVKNQLEISQNSNLVSWRRDNPELAERMDTILWMGKNLPPGAVQINTMNSRAIQELFQGKATGLSNKDGVAKQELVKNIIEAFKVSGGKVGGREMAEVENAVNYYAANADYLIKNNGEVKDVEKLYERIDDPAFAKALIMAGNMSGTAVNTGSIKKVGVAALLKVKEEVQQKLNEYKSEKGSLIINPATGLVQVRWESAGASYDTPHMVRTRKGVEEEVKRMNRFIKGITHLDGMEDYKIVSERLISGEETK